MFGWKFGRNKDNDDPRLVLPFDKVVDKKVVKVETRKIWECVSVSRSQFEDHYIGTIRNIAVYIQDRDLFCVALKSAADALQGTMIVRLPYDRPREQGAKVEQLWKYAMFSSHLLREAAKLNRVWLDRKGNRVLFADFAMKGLQYQDSDTPSSITMIGNLNQILPKSSAQWLLEDDEKCLLEVTRAAAGERCFIDSRSDVAENKTAVDKLDVNNSKLPITEKSVITLASSEEVKTGNTTDDVATSNVDSASGADNKLVNHVADDGMETGSKVKKSQVSNNVTKNSGNINNSNTKCDGSTGQVGENHIDESGPQSMDDVITQLALYSGGISETDKSVKRTTLVKTVAEPVRDASKKRGTSGSSKAVKELPKTLSVKGFEAFIIDNAVWEYTDEGVKVFPWQSTIQKYFNHNNQSDVSTKVFHRELQRAGYRRQRLDNQIVCSVPEESSV